MAKLEGKGMYIGFGFTSGKVLINVCERIKRLDSHTILSGGIFPASGSLINYKETFQCICIQDWVQLWDKVKTFWNYLKSTSIVLKGLVIHMGELWKRVLEKSFLEVKPSTWWGSRSLQSSAHDRGQGPDCSKVPRVAVDRTYTCLNILANHM